MYTTNWFKRIAGTGAALSVGCLALLCGCNHDDDCNPCDTGPHPHYHHPRVSDNGGRMEVQPAQYVETGSTDADFENDIYFRQHRLDSRFDRDAYFRDRGAYVRLHDGDGWWNDHRVELEASWNDGRHSDRDHRNNRDGRDGRDGRDNRDAMNNQRSNTERNEKSRTPRNTGVENRADVRDSRVEQRNELEKSKSTNTTPSTTAGAAATTNPATEEKSKDSNERRDGRNNGSPASGNENKHDGR